MPQKIDNGEFPLIFAATRQISLGFGAFFSFHLDFEAPGRGNTLKRQRESKFRLFPAIFYGNFDFPASFQRCLKQIRTEFDKIPFQKVLKTVGRPKIGWKSRIWR